MSSAFMSARCGLVLVDWTAGLSMRFRTQSSRQRCQKLPGPVAGEGCEPKAQELLIGCRIRLFSGSVWKCLGAMPESP